MSRAEVLYNNHCGDDVVLPPSGSDVSRTNSAPIFASPNLETSFQPELQFLSDTQIVNQVHVINTSGVDAYNVVVEMDLPPNISFGGAEITPTYVSASNVVWAFTNLAAPFGPLYDADGDGYYNDLMAREELEFWVTNYLDACTSNSELILRASFGCSGNTCMTTPDDKASFATISGSLVTWQLFRWKTRCAKLIRWNTVSATAA